MLLQLSRRYPIGTPKSAAEVAWVFEPPLLADQGDGSVALGRRCEVSPSSFKTLCNDPLDQPHAGGIAQFVEIPDGNAVGTGNGDRCEISVGQVLADIGKYPGCKGISQRRSG